MIKFKLLAAVVSALLLGVAAAGFAIADTTGPSGAQSDSASVQASALEQFGVFRRVAGPGDLVPPQARRMLAGPAERAGVDLSTAKAVAPSGAGYVWTFAGDQSVCLAIPDPVDGFGVACRSLEDALNGRLWVGLNGLPRQKAGDVRLAVFVPDSVDWINSIATDGTRHPVVVRDNVAFADVSDSDAIELVIDGEGEPIAVHRLQVEQAIDHARRC